MAQNFDPGETKYSDFFPAEAANYTEKRFYYSPKDGKMVPYLGEASHYYDEFGEGREGLLITGRTGDYEVSTPFDDDVFGTADTGTSKVRYLVRSNQMSDKALSKQIVVWRSRHR